MWHFHDLWMKNYVKSFHEYYCVYVLHSNGRKEGNGLFNDALNTFYLRLYGVRHVVKYHTDSEGGDPLLPHGLHQSWNTGWNENNRTMSERSYHGATHINGNKIVVWYFQNVHTDAIYTLIMTNFFFTTDGTDCGTALLNISTYQVLQAYSLFVISLQLMNKWLVLKGDKKLSNSSLMNRCMRSL